MSTKRHQASLCAPAYGSCRVQVRCFEGPAWQHESLEGCELSFRAVNRRLELVDALRRDNGLLEDLGYLLGFGTRKEATNGEEIVLDVLQQLPLEPGGLDCHSHAQRSVEFVDAAVRCYPVVVLGDAPTA